MNRLGVFARRPEPGRVKSRLSPALPETLACDLYRALLEDAFVAARDTRAGDRVVFWADTPGEPVEGLRARPQQGADLGERLGSAFSELLREPGDRAVIIGSDCPFLTAARIDEAFGALEHRDAVLGAARDGGYYLVGLRAPAPALFQGIAWGSERVLIETRARADSSGLSLALLAELSDIDTPDDLVRAVAAFADLATEAGGTPAARHTRDALAAMGFVPDAARAAG